MPALLIWDEPIDGMASFTLKIYLRHASHLEQAICILDKLISIGVDHMRIEVDFAHSPPEHEPHVVRSLEELIGDPLSIKTRLRGGSS